MTRIEYINNALAAIAANDDQTLREIITARPGTLRDALRSMLYKIDYNAYMAAKKSGLV